MCVCVCACVCVCMCVFVYVVECVCVCIQVTVVYGRNGSEIVQGHVLHISQHKNFHQRDHCQPSL